jgi:four helix bundle protein
MSNQTSQLLADQLEERLIDFAVRIIKLSVVMQFSTLCVSRRSLRLRGTRFSIHIHRRDAENAEITQRTDQTALLPKLSASLPKTPAGNHIAGQILRSGTSPAPNYGEARGAASHADFVHKLRIVLKELNETSIWLRIIKRSNLMNEASLSQITEENTSLCRIFTASLKTGRAHKRSAMTNEN